MAKRQRRRRTKTAAPFLSLQHRRAVWDRVKGAEAATGSQAVRLLRAFAQAGHEEEELVSIGEVEAIFSDFSQAIASCVPSEHHAALLEAVDRSSRKTLFAK